MASPAPISGSTASRKKTATERWTPTYLISHPIKFTRMAVRALLGRKKQGVVLLIASVAGLDEVYRVSRYMLHLIMQLITDTPIWDNDEELLSYFWSDRAQMLRPELSAASMVDLIQKGEYTCGAIFLEAGEVSKVSLRGLIMILGILGR
ncbi:uncharacterized protein BDCG_00981 [Blastomyces dermatitidis ER-3]|uniref:Uncharacterized protein n=1 Tax=Ajellomyces dermatitidis (strain ER-3 / ATCC MYA-2586) TaxID=559297 RepID=A0ABP2ELN0_AJEDR|nr:uncharacterized protein BDCG_00981 [Blastomyces dermatitidis ER-3]EEQ84176.1 hypothetical protein BDCG_00981 [Blastomyces dermatitidis ER-3]